MICIKLLFHLIFSFELTRQMYWLFLYNATNRDENYKFRKNTRHLLNKTQSNLQNNIW